MARATRLRGGVKGRPSEYGPSATALQSTDSSVLGCIEILRVKDKFNRHILRWTAQSFGINKAVQSAKCYALDIRARLSLVPTCAAVKTLITQSCNLCDT